MDALDAALKAALPNSVFPSVSDEDSEFLLCLNVPTATGAYPMNEEVAVYAVMFFLSSLVRYHPEYMDTIAQSMEAWLIESFVTGAPITLLRSLTSKILGYTIVMKRA